jgi:hypothetical protein
MASVQQTEEFDSTLRDVNVALDVLTNTLSGVAGCEYPRLLAREIQSLIAACIAHDKVRQSTIEAKPSGGAEALRDATLVRMPEVPSGAPEMLQVMVRTLEARDAEIATLRDVLHHGVETIEAHTLTDPDGTAVMHGEYQCISATALEQWLRRAAAVLNGARQATV